MLTLDLSIFFFLILISFRKKISIGFVAITGLLIYSIIFKKPISEPSLNLALIIISIITTTSFLSSSGGIIYISNIIEKIIIKHKSFIEIIAPIFTFIATLFCGSPYIVLAIIPIVIRISIEENIKPVYTVTGCVIGANHGYLCSPIGSPFIIISHLVNINRYYILFTLIFSCFIGLLFSIGCNYIRQKLDKSENPKIEDDEININNNLHKYDESKAKKAIIIFIIGLILMFIFGMNDNLKPNIIQNGTLKKSEMSTIIPLFMFSISCAIGCICKIKLKDVLKQKTMEYGFKSIITIIGISWLSNTLIENNKIEFVHFIHNTFNGNLIILGIILFFSSVFMASQTAALLIFIPIYLAIGVDNTSILKIIPFVDGLFFIPLTAIFSFAVEYDKTNSTKSGNYIFNHSLMIPGFIATSISAVVMYYII